MMDLSQFENVIQSKIQEISTIDLADPSKVRTNIVYEPDIKDLYRLYSFVIDNCVVSILEFGSGWSTLALSLGLQENRTKYQNLYPNEARNPHPFRICTVDNSIDFVNLALSRLDHEMLTYIDTHIASPVLTTVGVHPVTLWNPTPRFDFDLIYLDAPEPEQVVTSSSFLPMKTVHDLPIAGDLVFNEPYIHPETSIIVDGRTANARYLSANLRRGWSHAHYPEEDFSLLHLSEQPLGRINAEHINFRKSKSLFPELNYLQ